MSTSKRRSRAMSPARGVGRVLAGVALGSIALAGLGAAPAGAADAAAGAALAERWCASCHLVSPSQKIAQSDAAPSFSAIAAGNADLSAPWLAFRLLSPHPQMPQVSLSRVEAQDLAAYFASLRK